MKNISTRWITIASLVAAGAALNMGCSSDNSTPSDAGTGGHDAGAGVGGHVGTDAGTDTTPVVHLVNYTFDSTVQGWTLNNYADPNGRNLAGAYPTDGGADAQVLDGGVVAPPTLTFDSVAGDPTAGSLKISAIFTDCNQYVDASVVLAPTINLTGKTLHARLSLASGTFSGGAQLHLQTGITFDAYGSNPFVLSTLNGTFSTNTFPLSPTPPSADPAHPLDLTTVIQIGVQIFSGSACTALLPYPNIGEPVVFNIDTVTD